MPGHHQLPGLADLRLREAAIKASKGRIVIEPADKFDYKLEDLVAGITRENVHDEASFGGPAGKEAL